MQILLLTVIVQSAIFYRIAIKWERRGGEVGQVKLK